MRFKILDDPAKKMAELTVAVQKQILRKAVRAGAKAPREAAKQDAPKRLGVLGQSISVKIGTNKRDKSVYAVIGPRRGVRGQRPTGTGAAGVRPSKYAHLVEFGTRPHSLAKGDKLARRKQAAKQTAAGKKHPGAKANPFLERAYRQTAAAAKAAMIAVIEAEIKKKLAKRGR